MRPTLEQARPFSGKDQAMKVNASTTQTWLLPRRTSMLMRKPIQDDLQGLNPEANTPSPSKYAVIRRLEATPVQRPRVGQRTLPLSSLIIMPTPRNLGLPLEL